MEENQPQAGPSQEYMAKFIGIRFRSGGKLYNFDPGDLDLRVGDLVIVETASGLVCGMVAGSRQQVSLDYLKEPLKKVLRSVTQEDLETLRKNRVLEQEIKKFCYERIESRGMQMKLVDVEYLFDRSKVIFYFTADGRVDFRDLVKDLASRVRTRIEMRQIGVRDEAKMIGGLGTCGREFCCKTFVREFDPVSIKMAKQQNLTLNPAKISGACGRLMCCLSYENAGYCHFRKGLPKIGKTIMIREGPGRVYSHNLQKDSITVQVKDGKQIEIFEPDLTRLRQGLPLEEKPAPEPSDQALPQDAADAKGMRREPLFSPRQKERPLAAPPSPPREQERQEVRKEGLLSKIKKIAGVAQGPQGTERRRRRRRRRHGNSRGKTPGSSPNGSENK